MIKSLAQTTFSPSEYWRDDHSSAYLDDSVLEYADEIGVEITMLAHHPNVVITTVSEAGLANHVSTQPRHAYALIASYVRERRQYAAWKVAREVAELAQ